MDRSTGFSNWKVHLKLKWFTSMFWLVRGKRSISLEQSFNECGLSVASVLAKFLEPCVRSGSLHGQMLDMNMTFKNFESGEILISAILLISTCQFQLSRHQYSHGRHFMQARSWNLFTFTSITLLMGFIYQTLHWQWIRSLKDWISNQYFQSSCIFMLHWERHLCASLMDRYLAQWKLPCISPCYRHPMN